MRIDGFIVVLILMLTAFVCSVIWFPTLIGEIK